MTVVVGKIEPLKKLKEVLNQNGITRFNSIGEINAFIKNYESEKKEIAKIIEKSLDEKIKNLQTEYVKCQQFHDDFKVDVLDELNHKIKKLDEDLKQTLERSNKNLLTKIFYYLVANTQANKKSNLENNLNKIISKKTISTKNKVIKAKNKFDYFSENKQKIISTQCAESYKELDSTRKVIDGLYPVIAGAIGESSVVNELQKLPGNYYVINDFSVEFNPPIYNKIENSRIFSIQIDHLLIGPSGVFLLETKNWSKKSIKNIDLRSPVEQISRSGYALFVLLNSESKYNSISLTHHHWGSKKIPIRNIIIMTNAKPKAEFKRVKVLSLNELNGYVGYFDQVFSEAEVESVFSYLNNEKYQGW